MTKLLLLITLYLVTGLNVAAQPISGGTTPSSPAPRQQPRPTQPRLDLSDYGIQIEPDPRLIVMMAALDAAGWDPFPAGAPLSVFRQGLKRDLAGLDPVLRRRMKDFYERHKLKDVPDDPSTPESEAVRYTEAEQAASYVSLAYALGPAPRFEAPPRSDDLPAGVLDVLDFVTLLREFYRDSGMDSLLAGYVKSHRARGDELRAPSVEMARFVLSYLNTRPETMVVERLVPNDAGNQRKGANKKPDVKDTVTRERERRFVITPDLLAAPGTINLRVIAEDYFAVIPDATDPRSSELRRAYVQFVIDPLMLRFRRDISAKRLEIKQLVDAEAARTRRVPSPDVLLTVSRSLVAAADARMDEAIRLRILQLETSDRLNAAKDAASRTRVLQESKDRQLAIADATTSQLANAYERGAVLSFFFSDQLKGVEGSGFDIANFIPNMIAAIDPAREQKRPAEFAEAVARHAEARRKAQEARARESATTGTIEDPKRASMIKSLNDVEELIKIKNFEEAESRLTALKNENRNEPRVYFALGQVLSFAAQEAFDQGLQQQRLAAALGHFRQVVLVASPEADRSIILRAHLASGRILAHLDRKEEALKEFDAVLAKAASTDILYQQALTEKKKLSEQP